LDRKFKLESDGDGPASLPTDAMTWDDAVAVATQALESNSAARIKIIRVDDGRHLATVYSSSRGKPRLYRRST